MPKPSYLLVKIRKLKKRNKILSSEKTDLIDLNSKYLDLLRECSSMLLRYRTFLLKPSRRDNDELRHRIMSQIYSLERCKIYLTKHDI